MNELSLVHVQFDRAWKEWISGNDSNAASIWYDIMRCMSESDNDKIKIDVINFLAAYERIWEEKIESEIDIARNRSNAEIIGYTKGVADSLIELALRSKSPEVAIKQFHEARKLYEKVSDKQGLIKLIYQYGMFLVNRGIEKFGHIFNQFQTALQFAIEMNDKYHKAKIHHGIGEAFLRLENLKEANHHFEISYQIFNYLKNERKVIEVLVSKADVESQKDLIISPGKLIKLYTEFNNRISTIKNRLPISALFSHLSRFCELFLEIDDYKQANLLINEMEGILTQANINSTLYFQGKMSLALIKGNVKLKRLNLSEAEELYQYIIRRRGEAKITDLYGALISLAIISLYKFRIFFDDVYLLDAQDLIQDAIQLSEETDHVRGLLRAKVVDLMLKISIGDIDDIEEMEEVIRTARTKGLLTEAKRASEEIKRFKKRFTSPDLYEEDSVKKVLQYALEARKIVQKNQ